MSSILRFHCIRMDEKKLWNAIKHWRTDISTYTSRSNRWPDRDRVNCRWTYSSKSSSSRLLIKPFRTIKNTPKPTANKPVHTSSFHHVFFPKLSFFYVMDGMGKHLRASIMHIPKRFHVEMSSGSMPAPSKNIPNTTKTTPICSIPILVTTYNTMGI